MLRRPAVSGMFYPSEPSELDTMVRELIEDADAPDPAPKRHAIAAIVPHAGLIYSGRCAAKALRAIEIPAAVIIVGPNHTGLLQSPGASIWERGTFETPLCSSPVADDLASRLVELCPLVAHDPLAHLKEHSIEVELPLLCRLAPDVRIVPILLAFDDWNRTRELAGALARVVTESDEPVLLIASSDMTHYEPAHVAEQKDRMAIEAIERLDGEMLLSRCHREGITMCGRAPAAAVIEAARQLGATTAELVDYRHSGCVTGDDSSVVAYAGFVIS